MNGRRNDKEKNVQDVSERITGDDVYGSPGRVQLAMGESTLDKEKNKKANNRKKFAELKRRAAAGSSRLDRPSLEIFAASNAPDELENRESIVNLESDIHRHLDTTGDVVGGDLMFAAVETLSDGEVPEYLDCNETMAKGLDLKEVNAGKIQPVDVDLQRQRSEEINLTRLKSVLTGSVLPTVSAEAANANLQEQADEILALESIYGQDFNPLSNEQIGTPSFMINVYVEIGGHITLWVDQPSSVKTVKFENPDDGMKVESSRRGTEPDAGVEFTVQFLPPLKLLYTLPISYPSESPPVFILHCTWLNSATLSKLCSSLENIWLEQTPGQVVVYCWVEWLQTQALQYLGIDEKFELGPYGVDGDVCAQIESNERAACGLISFESDISWLLRYNEERKIEEFCCALHTCYICLSENLGFCSAPVSTYFCKKCLQTLASVNVKEGSVNQVNCPDTTCRGSIPPFIIKQLVDEEIFHRWENLVLQRSLDAMADIVYCPRCETVCIEEKDCLVQCTQCFFSFCSRCRGSWHVGQECMFEVPPVEIAQGLKKGNKWCEEQRRKLQNLKNEKLNLAYLHREAKQCPTCKMAISKTEGCNKMTCTNCGEFFCFRCGTKIKGYDHFRNGSCQLFTDEVIRNEIPRVQWQPQNAEQLQQAQMEAELWPERGRPCPNCRQLNVKFGNNNHIYCWACRNSYCCVCYKVVRRTSEHFGSGPKKCRQHSTH